jgi:hypothetical protein
LPKLTNPFSIFQLVHRSEHILLTRQQYPHPRGDDREQIARARQAAEALFTSKSPETRPTVPDAAPPASSARKPRVLQIISTPTKRDEQDNATVTSEAQPTLKIPRSHFSRIRTWLKYGMTVRQIAEVYGADVTELERILRKA